MMAVVCGGFASSGESPCARLDPSPHTLHTAPLMQKKRALVLQQEWGGKPCDHPAFAKEYDNGERTGNYICTQCGTTVTFREKAEIVAGRQR